MGILRISTGQTQKCIYKQRNGHMIELGSPTLQSPMQPSALSNVDCVICIFLIPVLYSLISRIDVIWNARFVLQTQQDTCLNFHMTKLFVWWKTCVLNNRFLVKQSSLPVENRQSTHSLWRLFKKQRILGFHKSRWLPMVWKWLILSSVRRCVMQGWIRYIEDFE